MENCADKVLVGLQEARTRIVNPAFDPPLRSTVSNKHGQVSVFGDVVCLSIWAGKVVTGISSSCVWVGDSRLAQGLLLSWKISGLG